MDDYQSDIHFGEWLRNIREKSGLSLERVAALTAMEVSRLKALEVGYADRGITLSEAKKLSAAYKVGLEELLEEAEAL